MTKNNTINIMSRKQKIAWGTQAKAVNYRQLYSPNYVRKTLHT